MTLPAVADLREPSAGPPAQALSGLPARSPVSCSNSRPLTHRARPAGVVVSIAAVPPSVIVFADQQLLPFVGPLHEALCLGPLQQLRADGRTYSVRRSSCSFAMSDRSFLQKTLISSCWCNVKRVVSRLIPLAFRPCLGKLLEARKDYGSLTIKSCAEY